MQSIAKLDKVYFKETVRGTNYAAINKWNEVVMPYLKIDNLKYFDVQEPIKQ